MAEQTRIAVHFRIQAGIVHFDHVYHPGHLLGNGVNGQFIDLLSGGVSQ
ncbi:hypothetical protein SRABI106_03496 [Rahnella aquatilis]|nr:hypothetical protein SRABI106_03496 [Rahnella aquatilis]